MMIRRLFFATIVLMVEPISTIAQTFSMGQFMWQNRPLLIFAPSAGAAQDLDTAVMQARDEFQDRDMVLIEVYQDDTAIWNGSRLPAGTAQELRKRYRVAKGDTTVILVGKDGGEKLRTGDLADLERIFRLIDSMPMRRREMQ